MTKIFVLYAKDLRQLFFSITGFLSVLLFPILLSSWMIFIVHISNSKQADLSSFFAMYSTMIILFIPVLTLKLWIEDNKYKTDELIKTLPFSEINIIVSRFSALLTIFSVIFAGTLLFPISFYSLGNFDMGKSFTNLFALYLSGAASIALCVFISTLVSGRIISWILSTGALLFLGSVSISGGFLSFLTFSGHMESFSRGLFSLRDVFYFAAVIIFSLLLSSKIILLRRWR